MIARRAQNRGWEDQLRLSAMLLAGAIALGGGLVTPAQALVPDRAAQAAPAPTIVQVDRRCGRGLHYVPRHRNRAGQLIRGHCVPNR
jgi:hypothetical protein